MTLKDNLITFFKRHLDEDRLTIADLTSDFNEISLYEFSTPTQFQYFKNALVTSKFISKDGKTILRFNWERILEVFPELIKDFKKARPKND